MKHIKTIENDFIDIRNVSKGLKNISKYGRYVNSDDPNI